MPRRRIERSSGTNCQPFFFVFFLHRCLVLHSRNKSGSCSSRPRVFAWFFKPPSIIIHLVSTCFHFPHFPPVSIHFGILLVSVKTKVGSAMETARAIRSSETWNVLESLGVRARRPPIDLAKKKWLWHFWVGDFSVLRSLAFPWSIPENGESYQMGTTTAVVWVWHPESSGGPTKSWLCCWSGRPPVRRAARRLRWRRGAAVVATERRIDQRKCACSVAFLSCHPTATIYVRHIYNIIYPLYHFSFEM